MNPRPALDAPAAPHGLLRCPKCGHHPLPADPSPIAACPACGVILAKAVQAQRLGSRATLAARRVTRRDGTQEASPGGLADLLWHIPERVDTTQWWLRAALLAAFAIWGLRLVALDHRDGEMAASFLHGVLVVFHEAGHVVFGIFGEWIGVLGGTLGQLLMPALLGAALLVRNRDPFGAAIGLWFVGVSLLDVAPYMYDARDPQLMLLTGTTGENGPHDWIYLFSSLGWLSKAQAIGTATHRLGAVVVLLAMAWAASVLWLQWRAAGDATRRASDA
ncbi:MAG TPA: hypothetical protein PKC97_11390 [Burkholderiaceae bacterium]|nr:hypothetical protein [Burkholderiaceae bacterium]